MQNFVIINIGLQTVLDDIIIFPVVACGSDTFKMPKRITDTGSNPTASESFCVLPASVTGQNNRSGGVITSKVRYRP